MVAEPLLLAAPGEDESVGAARLPLIAYARDRETLGILADVLSPALGPTARFLQGGIAQALVGLQRMTTPVAALLVDVSGESDPVGALEELAFYVEPGVRVIVIGDIEDMDLYRQIVRGLGVQDYLSKPLNRDMIARSILPLLTGGATAPLRGGRIVTVTGVRGGVGATTIAVNLAAQLADRSRHHILLFDANLNSGTAAFMLAAEVGGGLREALENPGRVDALFAERSAPAVSDRLHLLAAEEPLDEQIMAADGAVQHLAAILCNRFNFVVVDLPGHATPLNHDLRDMAHSRVLVMDATLPALRDMLRHLALPRGVRQAARPVVVLNRLGAPGALSRKQVAEGLGADVDVAVPWLPRQMREAINVGRPGIAKRGPFQTAISALANEMLPPRTGPGRFWTLLRRRQAE
jgi:pilus assembly protein CpaE